MSDNELNIDQEFTSDILKEITAEEVEEAQSTLSEDQLKGVAGGYNRIRGSNYNRRRPASQRAETQKGVAVVLGQLIELVWESGNRYIEAKNNPAL